MVSLKPPFYVISDTHWYHRNIIRYCGRPYDFEVMMVKRWQRAVKETDVILHLGDLFFGGTDGYTRFKEEIAPQLPGRKFLILGNHDKKRWDYADIGFTVLKPFTTVYRNHKVTFDHYPKLIDPSERRHIHIHGHIHNHGYARNEGVRWGNINVSVEMLDYRPHRITRLLNQEIRRRNGKRPYTNSRHYRWHKSARNRRRAA